MLPLRARWWIGADPHTARAGFSATLCVSGAVLIAACQDTAQSPPSRADIAATSDPAGSTLEPIDLVYVCGNKFLATNATPRAVQVEYRVVGTRETGSLTLREGPGEDPGHTETELETTKQGVVELFEGDERVAHRRNEGLPCGGSPGDGSPISGSIAAVSSSESGNWSAPFFWPVVALHLSLLPDGKVLSWGLAGSPQVWDPVTGGFTEVASPVELFCAGHSFLPDGRLLVTGGHISDDHGIPDITIFTPGTQSWSRSTPMRRGRWYPTNTTMANGDVVIVAGRDEAGVIVPEPEVWSSGGAVRVLSTAGAVLPYYPRAFLAPNGKLFYVGEMQTSRYLDISGTGSWTAAAKRLYGIRDYGSAVMFEPGKILYAGGGRTTNTAEVIDLNTAGWAAWRWTGSMAYPRRHLNATVLPTGQVLVTGGSSGTGFNDVAMAVHAAEVWDPSTGIWTTLSSNTVNRTYHATSILLPDGRVLHTGSGDNGSPSERNAELFSPPYLFEGPRPTISAAPEAVSYGTPFVVATPEASEVTKVSLIRLGSVTHAFDMNQRFQWLSFTRGVGALNITVPANPNRTPPGHYMLFILKGNGVPSIARIVRVSNDRPPDPPPNAPPAAEFTSSCSGLTCTFTDRSTDADGAVTAWSWTFGDGTSSAVRNPSRTYASGGTYTVMLTAADEDGATSQRSSTVTVSPAALVTNVHWWSENLTPLVVVLTTALADQTVAPDGQPTADLLQETSSAGQHKLLFQGRPELPNNASASFSVYVKPSGRKNWALEFRLRSNVFVYARFDLQAGVTLTVDSGIIAYTPFDVGNGWWRISAGIPNIGAGTVNYQPRLVMVADNGVTMFYTGSPGVGGYVWGIQAENRTTNVGHYVRTAAGPATSGP